MNFIFREKFESYPTNFNSIVHSHIQIKKIYVELHLKKNLNDIVQETERRSLNDTNSLSIINNFSNFTDLTKIPRIENESEINLCQNKANNESISSTSSDISSTLINNTGKLSIYSSSTTDLSINDNLSNSDYIPEYGNSNCIYTNPNIQLKYNYNPCSNLDYSTRKYSDKPLINNSSNNGYVDNYYGNHLDASYSDKIYESNNSCIRYNNIQSKMYARNDLNEGYKNTTVDSLNKYNRSYFPVSKLGDPLHIMLANYEGMCNFTLFANACIQYILKEDIQLVEEVKLSSFFKNFDKVSAFGMDINYIYESNYVI